MKYSLLFYETQSETERRDGPDAGAYWGAWSGYIDLLADSGVMVLGAGAGLERPSTATTIRGDVIHDGPTADTREQLSGIIILDVPSLDEAMKWAKLAPCVNNGAVEIRPVMPDPS